MNKKLKENFNIIYKQEYRIDLYNKLAEKEKELKEIKSILPFDLKDGEKLMKVKFISDDKKIHFPVICKNTDKVSRLEQLIYDEYPEYFESQNINYFVNEQKINIFKSLEDNKINNNSTIKIKFLDN